MTALQGLSRYWILTNDFLQDPYPILRRLRSEQPVCPVDFPDGQRIWLVTRYDDARAALSDPRLSRDIHVHYRLLSQRTGRAMAPPAEEANHLANLEPPRHTPLRRAISFAFTPRRAERLRPRIAEITDGLLDRIAGQRRADLIATVAQPLPVMTIAELMGVPATAWPDFLRWSTALRSIDPTDPSGALDTTVRDLSAYLQRLIADKRRSPGEDLLSALLHADDDDRRLSDVEVLSTGFALLTGGNDTTASLLGGVFRVLLEHPEQRRLLLADPRRWAEGLEELIRYTNPISNALQRVTTEPVVIGEVTIPPGEVVVISVMSANRDATQFPEPDTLDPGRGRPSHLSFGHGIHFCSGAHLARTITEVAATRLFTRFPTLGLAVPERPLRYEHSPVVRPLATLPVAW